MRKTFFIYYFQNISKKTKKQEDMREFTTILNKIANEYDHLHCICGKGFLKAIYDLYYITEGLMDDADAKSFLQLFADANDIMWSDAVEYLYCIMKESLPNFYEKNSVGLDWDVICPKGNDAYSKFLSIKGNQKYASKPLFELFCRRANIDVECCVRESVMDAYGWCRVISTIVLFVIEEYISVEERYENASDVISDVDEVDAKAEIMEAEEHPSKEEQKDANSREKDLTAKEIREMYGKRAVKAICLDDGSLRYYKSIGDVAKDFGIKSCTVSNFKKGKGYCRNKKNKKKYIFEFFEEDYGKTLMVDTHTKEIIDSYNKITDACKKWGFKYDKLHSVLSNKTSEHHLYQGYEWWREFDYNQKYKVAS